MIRSFWAVNINDRYFLALMFVKTGQKLQFFLKTSKKIYLKQKKKPSTVNSRL